MKVTREKRVKKHLKYYKYNFGFREPYQILIDITFVSAALNNSFDIKNQLKNYLQSEIKLLTTPCVIMESEKLGKKLFKVTNLTKTFPVHKCGHEANPISGANCLKSMSKNNHYIICTQDLDLQEWLRKRPGCPLIYLHGITPVFEAPSDKSKSFVSEKSLNLVENSADKKRLDSKVKKEFKEKFVQQKVFKKKLKKNPNPLSCKKKKKKPTNLENKTQ